MAEPDKSVMEDIEETARDQLSVKPWDRPAILRAAAAAGTDADLPYWIVLLISGAIATLGVALNNSAVVIGAMLIAPILAPLLGLSLSLATGDMRLAVQTGTVVLGSVVAVVAVAALITWALPFRMVTAEITSRTRPTTLDLAIAVFSGLAAGVVTVARRKRLSAAIPGVAVSVALIPPLAVVGFGIGAGWQWALIRGSLLLVAANLAGIILSSVAIFLLVGMHRAEVREAVLLWHEDDASTGLAAWVSRPPWIRRLPVVRSPLLRVGMLLGFVALLAVPLSGALQELTREMRVQRAVQTATEPFREENRSFVLGEHIVFEEHRAVVYLRLATTTFFGEDAEERFEREVSRRAGEPVDLELNQVLTGQEELLRLTARAAEPEVTHSDAEEPHLPQLTTPVQERIRREVWALPLPEGTEVAGHELRLRGDAYELTLAYVSDRPLPVEARQILARDLRQRLRAPDLRVDFAHLSTAPVSLAGAEADSARFRPLAAELARHDSLYLELLAGISVDSARLAAVVERLDRSGVGRRAVWRRGSADGILARLRVGTPPPPDSLTANAR